MKRVGITVCVCPDCVLNGAMDIVEAVESLSKLKLQLRLNTQVEISMDSHLDGGNHSDRAPVVMVNNELFESTNSENVMSKILSLSKDVKK